MRIIKLTLLLCPFLLVLPLKRLSAQVQPVRFGIKAGINASSLSRNASDDIKISKSGKMLPGYSVDAYAIIPLGGFAIQPGINFTAKGGKTTEKHIFNEDVSSRYYGNMRLYYIQVPVNVLYYFPGKAGSYFVGAGAYAGKAVKGTFSPKLDWGNNEIPEQNREILEEDIKFGTGIGNTFKSVDYGISALAGYKFKNNFFVNLSYNLGLNNIEGQKTSYFNDYSSTRTRSANVCIGFEF